MTGVPRLVLGWQDETDRSETAEQEDEGAVDAERLERRLDEIERLIDRAEAGDNPDRVRELRREGERLLDALEELERSREEDDEEFEGNEFEQELREMEMHRMHLEIERLALELSGVRQESVMRLAETAHDEMTSAVYAIEQLTSRLEAEHAYDVLNDLLAETDDVVVRRVLRHRLAELSFKMERPDEAIRQLQSLILMK